MATNWTVDEGAYAMFAWAYPHEAYADDPEAFWEFFRRCAPNTSRAEMEAMLKETEARDAR